MPLSNSQQYGKALTAIHRSRGIKIGQVPDERYGQVNAYRINIVEEYSENVTEGASCP